MLSVMGHTVKMKGCARGGSARSSPTMGRSIIDVLYDVDIIIIVLLFVLMSV